jgi:predicted enzyme related to lactoylglutathione lyase
MSIKYVHTNIIAKDWKTLTQFYIEVFNCKPAYPERDLSGEWIDKMTNLSGVRIQGIHLKLPGYDENGPTLEIFQYVPENHKNNISYINRQGYWHIAFHVDNVEEVLVKLIQNGGRKLRELVRKEIDGIGILTAVYAEDPESNFIEIQKGAG